MKISTKSPVKTRKKLLTTLTLIGLTLIMFLIALFVNRHDALLFVLSSDSPPALSEAIEEGDSVVWFDDYYTIQKLAENTYAIGEPRYSQANYNYLFIGETRAFLLDAGPGVRDIRPVVASLTDKPVTLGISHLHFDHIGNQITFANTAVIDVPHLRKQAINNQLTPRRMQHLGELEGIKAPNITVNTWLQPRSNIDLGSRTLKVIYTPGHTTDGMSIYDSVNNLLFTGDFINEGMLLGILTNSNMADYMSSVNKLLSISDHNTEIHGAHRMVSKQGAPTQPATVLGDLKATLQAISSDTIRSEGFIFPLSYRVNNNTNLIAEPRWAQNWEMTYPDLQ